MCFKRKKGTMMQCMLPAEYVCVLYEPPNINLPNITYLEEKACEGMEGIKVWVVQKSKQNFEKLDLLNIPDIIESALKQTIKL